MQELIEPFIEHQGEIRGFRLRKHRSIGARLVIADKSRLLPFPGKIVILLETEKAFGTGGHGSTEGCLAALDKFIRGGETVLDVGTGTGILSVAARKLGAGRITAVDIDGAACRETLKNLAMNGIDDGVDVIEGSVESVNCRYDLIAANIRTSLLVELMDAMMERLNPGGMGIFSGILERESHFFIHFIENRGLEVIETRAIHGWVTVVSRSTPAQGLETNGLPFM